MLCVHGFAVACCRSFVEWNNKHATTENSVREGIDIIALYVGWLSVHQARTLRVNSKETKRERKRSLSLSHSEARARISWSNGASAVAGAATAAAFRMEHTHSTQYI